MTAVSAGRVRVRDVADQIRGVSYDKADAALVPLLGYVPLIRAGNITDLGLQFDDLVWVAPQCVSAIQWLQIHDVVIAASSGSLDVVGKAAQLETKWRGTFGAFCKVLRPKQPIGARYFGHFFRTAQYRRHISSLAAGININNIRGEHLDDLMIPWPSVSEQQRIACILDQADALRAKRRRAISRLDSLMKAIFIETFGDAATNPRGWRIVELGEITKSTKLGLVRSAAQLGRDLPTRYIRMDAISRKGDLNLVDVNSTRASSGEIDEYSLHPGDFLFNTRNTKGLVGKTAIFNGSGVFVFNNNIMRLRFREDVLPEFVAAAFRTSSVEDQLAARTVGTTSVFAIYWKDLRTVRLPLPPLALQVEFGEKVAAYRALRAAHEVSRLKLDHLFANLQNRAFGGQL